MFILLMNPVSAFNLVGLGAQFAMHHSGRSGSRHSAILRMCLGSKQSPDRIQNRSESLDKLYDIESGVWDLDDDTKDIAYLFEQEGPQSDEDFSRAVAALGGQSGQKYNSSLRAPPNATSDPKAAFAKDTLFIRGLPFGITDEQVKWIFSAYGTIVSARCIRMSMNDHVLALVRFANPSEAKWVMRNLHDRVPAGLSEPVRVLYHQGTVADNQMARRMPRQGTLADTAYKKFKALSHSQGARLESNNSNLSNSLMVFNAAIVSYGKGGQWNRALAVFTQMRDAGVSPDEISFTAALSACRWGKYWQGALLVLYKMRDAGISPDVVHFNSVMDVCEKSGQWAQAVALFEEMCAASITPNSYSYGSVMSALRNIGDSQQVLSFLGEMRAKGITPNIAHFSAAIQSCEKSGPFQQALSLLAGMSAASIHPTPNCLSAAISASGKCGQWQQALSLFREMQDARVAANVRSFNAAISACEKNGQVDQARLLFNEMLKEGLTPTVKTLGSIISALGGSGRLPEGQMQKALSLYDGLRDVTRILEDQSEI